MGFRMGLLVGGLGVAVVALIVTVIVLATDDSSDQRRTSTRVAQCPAVEAGGPAEIDLSGGRLNCLEAKTILNRHHQLDKAHTEVSGWVCEEIPFAEYPVLIRCRNGDGSRFDVLGTAPSAHRAPDPAPLNAPIEEGDRTARPQFFYTPSGNIACALTPAWVRCDISERNWNPFVPKPSSCHFDWGPSVGVQARGYGEFLCVGDSLFGGTYGELPYGNVLKRGELYCVSKKAALLCANQTGGGFRLSAQSVKLL